VRRSRMFLLQELLGETVKRGGLTDSSVPAEYVQNLLQRLRGLSVRGLSAWYRPPEAGRPMMTTRSSECGDLLHDVRRNQNAAGPRLQPRRCAQAANGHDGSIPVCGFIEG